MAYGVLSLDGDRGAVGRCGPSRGDLLEQDPVGRAQLHLVDALRQMHPCRGTPDAATRSAELRNRAAVHADVDGRRGGSSVVDAEVVVPGLGAGIYLSTAISFITGFIRTIPNELEEAARVDGAGPVRIFFAIAQRRIIAGITGGAVK